MNLNELAKKVYQGNAERGFHDETKPLGVYLMLMVSELSEALEADRNGNEVKMPPAEVLAIDDIETFRTVFKMSVKDTVEDELADCLIRILDYCGLMGIDIQSHVHAKLRYNATRGHRHGGKAY